MAPKSGWPQSRACQIDVELNDVALNGLELKALVNKTE